MLFYYVLLLLLLLLLSFAFAVFCLAPAPLLTLLFRELILSMTFSTTTIALM